MSEAESNIRTTRFCARHRAYTPNKEGKCPFCVENARKNRVARIKQSNPGLYKLVKRRLRKQEERKRDNRREKGEEGI